jgi:hypothetical protein
MECFCGVVLWNGRFGMGEARWEFECVGGKKDTKCGARPTCVWAARLRGFEQMNLPRCRTNERRHRRAQARAGKVRAATEDKVGCSLQSI